MDHSNVNSGFQWCQGADRVIGRRLNGRDDARRAAAFFFFRRLLRAGLSICRDGGAMLKL
jgi:hypothetical protein